jgi:hypothetical protein
MSLGERVSALGPRFLPLSCHSQADKSRADSVQRQAAAPC